MKAVLIAIDGLAKSDVEEYFVLEQVKQKNIWSIELGDRPYYFTSELFTDLYTGMSNEEHGIVGLNKFTGGKYGFNPTRFESWLQGNLQELFFHSRSFRQHFYAGVFGSEQIRWERQDINAETIFEKYGNVSQGQMPVWDWRKADPLENMKKEYDAIEKTVSHIQEEWMKSKRKFFNDLDGIDWESHEDYLYLHHFHYIDWLQHLYANMSEDEEGFRELMSESWWSVGEFVEEVKESLPDDVALIVMSDHGRPLRYEGHENDAFISSDVELFDSDPSMKEVNWKLEEILEGWCV